MSVISNETRHPLGLSGNEPDLIQPQYEKFLGFNQPEFGILEPGTVAQDENPIEQTFPEEALHKEVGDQYQPEIQERLHQEEEPVIDLPNYPVNRIAQSEEPPETPPFDNHRTTATPRPTSHTRQMLPAIKQELVGRKNGGLANKNLRQRQKIVTVLPAQPTGPKKKLVQPFFQPGIEAIFGIVKSKTRLPEIRTGLPERTLQALNFRPLSRIFRSAVSKATTGGLWVDSFKNLSAISSASQLNKEEYGLTNYQPGTNLSSRIERIVSQALEETIPSTASDKLLAQRWGEDVGEKEIEPGFLESEAYPVDERLPHALFLTSKPAPTKRSLLRQPLGQGELFQEAIFNISGLRSDEGKGFFISKQQVIHSSQQLLPFQPVFAPAGNKTATSRNLTGKPDFDAFNYKSASTNLTNSESFRASQGRLSEKRNVQAKPTFDKENTNDRFSQYETGYDDQRFVEPLTHKGSSSEAAPDYGLPVQTYKTSVLPNLPASMPVPSETINAQAEIPVTEEFKPTPASHSISDRADWPVLGLLPALSEKAQSAVTNPGIMKILRRWPQAHTRAVFENLPALGPGEALAHPVRTQMEGILGRNFSRVRVYESPLAQALGAEAFTSGEKVVFAPGRLDWHSPKGLALLGHELSHVGQSLGFKQNTAVDDADNEPEEQAARQQEDNIQQIIEQGWPTAPRMEVRKAARSLATLAENNPGSDEAVTSQAESNNLVSPAKGTAPALEGSGNGTRTEGFGPVVVASITPLPPASSASAAGAVAEPDLETLARQVYALLKGKLRAEHDRRGIYSR